MCGLFGWWTPSSGQSSRAQAISRLATLDLERFATPGEAEIASAMANALHHRGPDDSGFWMDPGSGLLLGHTRLAIRDPAASGAQPMVSSDGRWVTTYNGELYGIDAVRDRLRACGIGLRGHSDTEVLVEACALWGVERASAECNGMFAFALWDKRERQLWLGRDRFGKKPLYYIQTQSGMWFASELKAFHAASLDLGAIDSRGLIEFLQTGAVPDQHCIFESVDKVQAGTLLRFDALGAKPRQHRYWSVVESLQNSRADPIECDFDSAVALAEGAVQRAVEERLVADVPVGALLSGGLDSATVVALMKAVGIVPQTFTIGFDEKAYDESDAAEAVALALGTKHRTLRVDSAAALEVVPQLADIYDEPFADASQIPTVLISRLVREHVAVCLTGDGADEIFGGYNRHRLLPSLLHYSAKVPQSVRSLLARGVETISPANIDKGLGTLLGGKLPAAAGEKAHKLAALSKQRGFDGLYKNLVAQGRATLSSTGLQQSDSQMVLGAPFLGDSVERLMYLDTEHYLRDDILVKVDRASMSCSLELRSPYLDHRLFELVWRMPSEYRVQRKISKRLLRAIAQRHLPPSVLQRPKSGFAAPIGHWLRGPLRDWGTDLLQRSRLADVEFIDAAAVEKLWRKHQRGQMNAQYALWPILMYQAWRARWLRG